MTDTRLRVLLIDDDPLWRRLIGGWLGRLRHPSFLVESSGSYGQGLELLLRGAYDACIVDHQRGTGPTGFDLLREARKAGCDIPILLLTADGEEELDVVALRAGAADYLEKAGLTEGLTGRAVRYAMERGRSLEALRQSEARLVRCSRTPRTGCGVRAASSSRTSTRRSSPCSGTTRRRI